mgnify:CR=1 FL=1
MEKRYRMHWGVCVCKYQPKSNQSTKTSGPQAEVLVASDDTYAMGADASGPRAGGKERRRGRAVGLGKERLICSRGVGLP